MKKSAYIFLAAAALFAAASCESEIQTTDGDFGVDGIVCFQPVLCGNGDNADADAGDDAERHAEPDSASPNRHAELDSASPKIAGQEIAGQARNDGSDARNDGSRHAELDSASRTKAPCLVSADGSISVPLQYEVSNGISVMPHNDSASPETKGNLLNTSGSDKYLGNDDYSISSFYVKAYKGSSAFISSYEQVTEGSDSYWRTSTSHLWGATENATFYAYANLPSATGAAIVSSSTSVSQMLVYFTNKVQSASAQTDILMGFYSGKSRYDATKHIGGIVDIKFYHPLTAVRFKLGEFTDNPTVVINKISISGVHAAGVATMTPPAGTATAPAISWTPTTASGTTTVTLGDGTSALSVGTTDKLIGEPFLLIPQKLTDQSVKVTVNLTLNGTAKTLEADISTGEWKAGKTNTYTLGYDSSTYFFSLSSTTTVITADKTFTNTTSSASEEYDIYSEKTSSSTTDWDWDIKSYQIGTAEPVNVSTSATNFTAGGLVVSEDKTNSKLKITAQEKVVGSPGSNAYWQNTTTPVRTDNLDWSPESWEGSVIDLSKYDFQSDETDAHLMTTANCYIIRHAGTYKIPLVYGNAVKDGAINTTAYNPGTTGSTSNLSSYVTHKGIAITSPFIEYNKTSASSSTNLSPTGCRVVWSENSGVISDIEIPSSKESVTIGGTTYNISYLTFIVPQDKICQNNAVIAVSDGSGSMWSWHIWTTNDPDVAKDPVVVKPNATKEYKFFPMSLLGWIEPTSYLARSEMKVTLVQKDSGNEITITVNQPRQAKEMSTGVMYQWGRKDPMPSKNSVDGFTPTIQNAGVDLATAIKNPGNAYYPSSTTGGNWCSTNYYNLWSGTLGTPIFDGSTQKISVSNDATTKTVYDPSPVGYKVPSIFAFSAFSKTGVSTTNVSEFNKTGDFNVGWNFYTDSDHTSTIFFYAAGWRDKNNGLTNSTDGDGNYHSAFQYGTATANSNNMCYFSFGTSKLELTNTQSKSLGACVRPVKE